MARKSKGNETMTQETNENTASVSPYEVTVPKDYEEIPDDIGAFWDPELQPIIHLTIKSAKVFDSSIDKSKPSILLTCTLNAPALLRSKDEDGNPIEVMGKKGDTVGVWGKPGMKNKVLNLAGVDLFLSQTGEKNVGKGNPMKTYSVRANPKGVGKKIPLIEDTRDKSRYAKTWWTNEVEDLEEAPF